MESGSFPNTRLRRLRDAEWIRSMVREHRLTVNDLIWPIFVHEHGSKKAESTIKTMPGVSRLTMKQAVEAASMAADLGIKAIAIFPAIDVAKKDAKGSEALNAKNLVCQTVKAIKKATPKLGVICDVALDPYTSHGQDGLVIGGYVANDATVAVLAKQAVVLADAGADVVAPSDMMDGRVGAVRHALDKADHSSVKILSYAAKYASAFYGPFRDAVGSKAALGKADKRTYQMDPANIKEALREVALDIQEGADMVMVKPGMPYLDVIHAVSQEFPIPLLAYQVSGEYAMLKFAAQAGAIEYQAALMESLLAFKRAGASAILTYGALDAAKELV